MCSLADTSEDALRSAAAVLLGAAVSALSLVESGANNRVYRLIADGRSYALKLYPAAPGDNRDRLHAEALALEFLNRHGVGMVPAFIAAEPRLRIGLHEWIEGEDVGVARDEDIMAALALLRRLHALRGDPAAVALPLASEACLSGAELVGQVERRLCRLREVAPEYRALAVFLEGVVAPVFDAARMATVEAYHAARLDFNLPLDPARQSLSPSDFGFHNARRRTDGSLVFHDFEYFGWDDPVKPVADFVLHPGMTMTEAQRRDFVTGAAGTYGVEPTYGLRLRALFPLYGLRWCLILLNEFLPERWMRRVRAGAATDRASALARQLAKAEAMIDRTRRSLAAFPYGD